MGNIALLLCQLTEPDRKVIVARFIGQDGSCGFIKNQQYCLISHFTNKLISISSINTPRVQKCPYASLAAFLMNWIVDAVVPLNELKEWFENPDNKELHHDMEPFM